MKNLLHTAIFTILTATAVSAGSLASGELETVGRIDLQRYSGRWYEIAKYPNRFQKQCVANTTAEYTIKPNGRLEVLNKCQTANGTVTSAVGEGKISDKKNNSKLKVRFAPDFISWLPFVWANYWIIDLGPNYEYAVVGEPGRNYLWILSRTPEMKEDIYTSLLDKVKAMGFDPQKIEKTPQETGS